MMKQRHQDSKVKQLLPASSLVEDMVSTSPTAMQAIPSTKYEVPPSGTTDKLERPNPFQAMDTSSMSPCYKIVEVFASPTMESFTATVSSTLAIPSIRNERRRVTPMSVGTLSSPTTPKSFLDNCKLVTTNDVTDLPEYRKLEYEMFENEEIRMNDSSSPTISAAGSTATLHNIHYRDSLFFPVIVHRMINQVSNASNGVLMRWNESGEKFWIDQKSPDLCAVLKGYFKRTFLCYCLS
jgi:hypothetical protein